MDPRRSLPKVDAVGRMGGLEAYPEAVRNEAARRVLQRVREDMTLLPDLEKLASDEARRLTEAKVRPLINLSGVVLHTGLGRARLAPAAAMAVRQVAESHAAVEFELETGRRGDRQAAVRDLLCELTGAEDALVVNNAAAGVFLTLTALTSGREVILSRGEMVEIGGSFRMPDIVRQSGARLVEVGCTNKTHLRDYQAAISPETAAILRCHPSNFKIIGFTHAPTLAELKSVAEDHGVSLIDDQGSGCLVDLRKYGLSEVPTLPESVQHAHVSIASGDKLLGGPQAGLILGRADLIAQVRSHPLARAVRIDKLTLAALEATLRLYRNAQEQEIPTLRYLGRSLEDIRGLAERLAKSYPGDSTVQLGQTEVGGGSAPGEGLPTWRVGLHADDAEAMARSLRQGSPGIVGRIESGRLWLDPRTLDEDEVSLVEEALFRIGKG